MCYTIIVKRECGESADPAIRTKKIQRNLKNPLDKPHRMCYNECVKRRERGLLPKTSQEKKCKKPLDKRHKMCYNECVKRGTPQDQGNI
jgi:hypothetical protein